MRIGIDIRRSGGFGVGTYVRNLIASLAHVGPQHEYVLIGSAEQIEPPAKLGENFGFPGLTQRRGRLLLQAENLTAARADHQPVAGNRGRRHDPAADSELPQQLAVVPQCAKRN